MNRTWLALRCAGLHWSAARRQSDTLLAELLCSQLGSASLETLETWSASAPLGPACFVHPLAGSVPRLARSPSLLQPTDSIPSFLLQSTLDPQHQHHYCSPLSHMAPPSTSLFSSGGAGAGGSSSSSNGGSATGSRKSAISLAFNNGINGSGPHAPLRDRLAARSRVTNLGIVLLLSATALSVLLNLRYLALGGASRPPKGFASWSSFHGTTPAELKANLPSPPPGSNKLDHLVIVTGHAVWAGCDFEGRSKDENWILEPYQVGGSVETFWKHIEKGLEIADADPKALLVFSG